MKVLFVSSGASFQGISPFIRSQGESLREAGLEVDFFTMQGRGLKGYLRSIPQLRRKVKAGKYDIIHAHYGLSGWTAVLAFTRTPIVISFMGGDVYGDVDEQGRRTHQIVPLMSKLLQLFVEAVIVKSPNLERYVWRKRIISVIPNGVNFQRFAPRELRECRERLGLDQNMRYVLFLGNPADPRKNIRLAKAAQERLADPCVQLLAPYPVPHVDIPDYLNAADLLIMTSHLEGSPNVVKEAMACNCPVASVDVGDAASVIGKTEGCCVCPYDADALARGIRGILETGKRTKGRSDMAHLDEKAVAQRIVAVYREAASG